MLAVTTDTPTPKGRSHLRARTETGDIGENESEKCDGSTPGDRHCLTLLAVFHPRGRYTHMFARTDIHKHECVRTPMAVSDSHAIFLLHPAEAARAKPGKCSIAFSFSGE